MKQIVKNKANNLKDCIFHIINVSTLTSYSRTNESIVYFEI